MRHTVWVPDRSRLVAASVQERPAKYRRPFPSGAATVLRDFADGSRGRPRRRPLPQLEVLQLQARSHLGNARNLHFGLDDSEKASPDPYKQSDARTRAHSKASRSKIRRLV